MKIYCDLNTLSHISGGFYPEDLVRKFKDFIKSGLVDVHCTVINFDEIIQGVRNEEDFQKAKGIVITMLDFSKNKMLEDSQLYVQKAVCRYLKINEPDSDKVFLNMALAFSQATCLDEIKVWFEPTQTYLKQFHKRWQDNTIKLTSQLENIHINTSITVDEFLGGVTDDALWESIKGRFQIEPYVKDAKASDIIPRVLPIAFWYFLYIGYCRKLGEDKRKPLPSDYFDLEQTVYLDQMDFFIYKDSKHRKVINRSLLPELGRKCVSFEELLTKLDSYIIKS